MIDVSFFVLPHRREEEESIDRVDAYGGYYILIRSKIAHRMWLLRKR